MITRTDLAHIPVGDVRSIDGTPMRHMGGGQFCPATVEPLFKRFDFANDPAPLHRPMMVA